MLLFAYAGNISASLNDDFLSTVVLNDIKEIKNLLAKGAYINAKDKDGYTALMKASQSSSTETVKLLLDKGADVNVKSDFKNYYEGGEMYVNGG